MIEVSMPRKMPTLLPTNRCSRWDEEASDVGSRMEKALQLQCRQLLDRLKVNQSQLRETLPTSRSEVAPRSRYEGVPDTSSHLVRLPTNGTTFGASTASRYSSTQESSFARSMLKSRAGADLKTSLEMERGKEDTADASRDFLGSQVSQELSPRQSAMAALSRARTSRSAEANNNSTMLAQGSAGLSSDRFPLPSTSDSFNNSTAGCEPRERSDRAGRRDVRGRENEAATGTAGSIDLASAENLDRSLTSHLTPKSLRRYVIDKNVKVDNDNVNWGRNKYSDDIRKTLNFSYSKVDDEDDGGTFAEMALASRSDNDVFRGKENLQDLRRGDFTRSASATGSSHSKERECRADTTVGGTSELQMRSTSPGRQSATVDPSYVRNLEDDGNSKTKANFAREAYRPKSILSSSNARRRQVNSRVSFQSSDSGTSRLGYDSNDRKMLGYDWIAALMDNDPNLINESETFFEDLREFRRTNRDECSNQFYMSGPSTLELTEPPAVEEALSGTKVKPYRVNERLFTEPVKRHKLGGQKEEPEHVQPSPAPTQEAPRFVRVSIPRSTLLAPTRFKPHRRNSFDASDSCALSEHCLLGWENSRPSCLPSASNVGLSDALDTSAKPKYTTTLEAAERLAASYPHPLSRPSPRLDLFPTWRRHYQDAAANLSLPVSLRQEDLSQTIGNSSAVRQNTDDILNSTYAMMYDSQRLQRQRSQHDFQQTGAKA